MTEKKKAEREDEAVEPRPDAEAEIETDVDAEADGGSDAEPDAEAPDAEERLARERDDYKDRWLRAVAEQENVRKRTRREVGDARRFAVADLLRELLEVLDNFERAAASASAMEEGAAESDALRSGFELIHGRFREILEGRGVTTVPAEKGQAFDPAIHEAVLRVESEDVASGEIVDVAQTGYKLDDLVLRPARVVVAQ